ncbi:MAG: hypothetical protein CM15mP84_11060 [Cellvibrionales bacterium]|nr:MAG: hypothetical protein CM15mP84_11060 [Cellvibrionales bacterium]
MQWRITPMTLFAATTAFFVFIFVAIGNYAGRRVKTLEDYYVAGGARRRFSLSERLLRAI